MPTFDYECSCGEKFEVFYAPGYTAKDKAGCQCGKQASRVFTPSTEMIIPVHMRASFKESVNHKKWLERPDTKAKIKSGELAPLSKSHDLAQD